ncbi:MAG: DUF1446 domain-containing protein [Oceanospirillales bacterium]|nr:DUF1446 domain-containing protein [Oceanospirillales bacterium]
MTTKLMVGGGAGFAGDRFDAAVAVAEDLATQQGPRYLIFETLAERTLALSQDPSARAAREHMMLARLRHILPLCLESGIRIIGNFGSWSPQHTAREIHRLSRELGCRQPRVAVVIGDDLMSHRSPDDILRLDIDTPLALNESLISANVYLGAFPIAQALDQGADIVVTGRVADPSLVLGPMISTMSLGEDDLDALACGTLAGHLIECGAQVCGGYFADPGVKEVENLAWVGFPIVEITDDLHCLIRKPANTGGRVDALTVTEQLLYEIHDPSAYLTPDVTLDISQVQVTDLGDNRVLVGNARGVAKPECLKATLCFEAGWIGEAEISYAGPNAAARAALATEVIRTRAERLYPELPIRCDLIGVISAFNSGDGFCSDDQLDPSLAQNFQHCDDVRVRIATRDTERARVDALLAEVEALYTTGPAGGGGVRSQIQRRIATASAAIPRDYVTTQVLLFGQQTGAC